MRNAVISMVVILASLVLIRDGIRHVMGEAYCNGTSRPAPVNRVIYL